MLWLCLYFPQLPLEIFARAQAPEAPLAVTEGGGARRRVAWCNGAAAAAGVRPGMALAAAGALSAGLQARDRDGAAEAAALAAAAAWAGQFTPLVSLHPPQGLLLEIAGSLKLFSGLERLLRRVRTGAAALGYRLQMGVAPTPLAAALLARVPAAAPVMQARALPGALQDLPLALLGLDEAAARALQRVGLKRLGELLRLPRAGLARRLGPALVDHLDRLMGHRPDPRPAYRPPDRFERCLALPAETADAQALLFPARRLLAELAGFLTARQAGTQGLDWALLHEGRPATRLAVGLAAPRRDADHLLALLRERLERTALDYPVVAMELSVAGLQPLPMQDLSLYGEQAGAGDWAHLVERLRARLGDGAVQGLQCRPDHRPERAWAAGPPGEDGPPPPALPRPLWLLEPPVALAVHGGAPCLGGPLALVRGPERIESGWWDGADAARDYFIATDAAHARYWVFHERRGDRGWFLHGLFA